MKRCKALSTVLLILAMLIAVGVNNSTCSSAAGIREEARVLPRSTVGIVRSGRASTEDIDYEEILSMAREAVRLAGGLDCIVKNGDTVVIKPNLVNMTDYTLPGWQGKPLSAEGNGTTTDYRLTRAVVALVRELNPAGKVYVMEGSCIPTKYVFSCLGYDDAHIPGVDGFIALETDSVGERLVQVDVPGGLYGKKYFMNRTYKEADVLIGLPCLKNHWQAVVSGSVKNVGIGATPGNVYGNSKDSPGRNSKIPHSGIGLHYWIHDYFMARPVDFAIMDGLAGIQNGPTPCFEISGSSDIALDRMNMRLVLASRDSVALDTVESLVMGWDPGTVEYLNLLNRDGLGNTNVAYIDVNGARADEVRKRFAGSTGNFAWGGAQYADYEPPALSVKRAETKEGRLVLEFDVSPDTSKVELLADGERIGSAVTSGFGLVAFPVTGVAKNARLELVGYDAYLNAIVIPLDPGLL